MERRIVEIVGIGQDLPDVFPSDALDPRIADDVLRIVDSKKAELQIARVQSRRRKDAQTKDAGVQLP